MKVALRIKKLLAAVALASVFTGGQALAQSSEEICGARDLHDITCYKAGEACANPAKYTAGTSVARIKLVYRNPATGARRLVFGSGFVFIPAAPNAARQDLLLTNNHVVNTPPPPGFVLVRAQAEFLAEYGNGLADCAGAGCFPPAGGCQGVRVQLACWDTRPACDFALVKLAANAPAGVTRATLGGDILPPSQIVYIPQHPRGRCKEIDTNVGFAAPPPPAWEFEHRVDTEKGSSGSPVFYENAHFVVGIHFRGPCTAVLNNGAVKISAVIPALPAMIAVVDAPGCTPYPLLTPQEDAFSLSASGENEYVDLPPESGIPVSSNLSLIALGSFLVLAGAFAIRRL